MSERHLRRYTNIPALIYLLRKRSITLLDPRSWTDSNDSYYLTLYRDKKGLKSVLALCFTEVNETYHHWSVFAAGSSGICIRFKRSHLLRSLRSQEGLRAQSVRYLTVNEINKKRLAVEDLPFLKRYPYEQENEFRIIFESKMERKSRLDIAISLSSIDKITLSPWIHPALSGELKAVLKSIEGCKSLRVVRSTLIGNEEWKIAGEQAR